MGIALVSVDRRCAGFGLDRARAMIAEQPPFVRERFEIASLHELLPHTVGIAHHADIVDEALPGIEHPEDFLLLVWWETLEDHNVGFRESPAFQEWRAILGPLFAAPPAVVHHYEPL